MSAEEIDTLRDEAAPAPDVDAVTEAPVQDVLVPPDPALSRTLGMVAMGVSRPLCRRAHVTHLQPEEGMALGEALANLVTAYDVGPKDPKGAAWLGMGLTMAAIVGNREPLQGPKPGEVDTPPQPVDAPPAPVFGDVTASDIVTTRMDQAPCG